MTRIAGRQISDDGLASIGDVLTWDGTKWYPAPSAGGVTPPLSPADNGKFARALSGDLVYVTVTQVTADLNLFTDTLQGVVPASGGGSVNFLRADGVWAAPGGGVTPPVGGTGEVAYASGSDLAYASDVKIAGTGTALAFGTTPALTGLLRVPHASTLIVGRNQPNNADVNLLQWGNTGNNRLTIGSTGVSDTYFNISTGSGYNFQVNGTVEYTFDSTSIQLNSNNLVSAGFLSFTGSGPTSGLVRVPHASSVVVGRNAANSADALLLTWGTAANNRITLGDTTVAEQYQNVATGGTYNLQVNSSTEYTFDATQLTWNGNNSVGAGFYSGTGTVAGSGLLRGANNTVLVAARNAGNTADVTALGVNASDAAYILGTGEYVFDPTNLTMNLNNIVGAGFISLGTNPAGGGLVRVPHNVNVILGRNSTNTGDTTLLNWGATTDSLLIGSVNVVGTKFNLATGGVYTLQVNGATEYTFDASALTMNSNNIVGAGFISTAGTAAGAGFVRVAHGTTGAAGRNNANTVDVTVWSWGVAATDTLVFGDANVAGTTFNLKTGGTYTFQVNGTTEYTFDATQFNLNSNALVGLTAIGFTGNIASAGLIRVAHGVNVIEGRNQLNTADSVLMSWGTGANNRLTHGDTVTAEQYFNIATGGTYNLQINSATEYTFDASTITMNGNSITGALFISSTGTAAGTGFLRTSSAATIIVARNNANTGDITVLSTDASDHFVLGSTGATAGFYNVATGGSHTLQVNSATEYTFDATQLTMNGNNLIMGAGFAQFGTNPATTGNIRFPQSSQIYARNNANNADLPLIRMGAVADTLNIGGGTEGIVGVNIDTTSGSIKLRVANADEYTFSSTGADFTNNFIQFGTNPAASGTIRFPHGSTGSIVGRNSLNNADRSLLRWGITNTDELAIGNISSDTWIHALATVGFFINALQEYTFGTTAADFKDNTLQFGTNPSAAAGLVRIPNNVTFLGGRNSTNTTDVSLLRWGVSTVTTFTVGENNTITEVELRVASGGQHSLVVANGLEYIFNGTTADFTNNVLQFGTNPATAGTIRFANNLPITWRNTLNTVNVQGIVVATDNAVYVGDSTNAAAAYVVTAGGFGVRPNGVGSDSYTFTSTQANFRNSTLLLSSTPAASGIIRFGTNPGTILACVNYDSTGDQTILSLGGSISFTDLRLGDNSAKGTNTHYYQSKAQHIFVIGTGGTQYFTIDANKMFVHDTSAAPTTDPVSGGFMYSETGAGKWRGSSGTVTTFGPAEPHCPRCGSDFAIQYSNPKKYGDFSGCMLCLNKALQRLGISEDEWVIEHKEAA